MSTITRPRKRLNLDSIDPVEFAHRLLGWFDCNKRNLPWRANRDPYRIWVSEVMLQQTQVKTVLTYFERFLEAFPSLEDLARAELDKVLSLWSGLGYYSRARNLHRAARIIADQHGGRFPRELVAALALPGVGRYTAGAVLSIAYGRRLPVLDGNIRRLLVRFLAICQEPNSLGDKPLWDLLESLVQDPAVEPRVGDFNEALMELGALVCTPLNPSCGDCPLEPRCRANSLGIQHELPAKQGARQTEDLHFCVAVVFQPRGFLLRKTREGPILRGFWDFPRVVGLPGPDTLEQFQRVHRLQLEKGIQLSVVRHQITHRRLHFHPLICTLRSQVRGGEWRWSDLKETGFPVTAHVRKIAAATGQI